LDKILEYYKKDTHFLDIGSNYGCHSIGVANEIKKNNGNGKVYSFELQPEIFKLFEENVKLNGLEEVIIPQFFGLGDKNENKNFIVPNDYDVNANPGGLSFLNQNLDENSKNENAEIKRLDDLNIDNISVIKIDVEGYELEVFEGGKATIEKNRPVIIIEMWKQNKDKYFDWIHTHFPFYTIEHIHADDYLLIAY
jgi:FkbM family methyltransferase